MQMNEARTYIPAILAALIVSILPHLGRLPLWIIVWCVFMWGYIFFSLKNNWPWPSRAVRLVLTAMGIIGLMVTYSVKLGPNAYLGLLAVMAAIKPFEVQTHRDRMITIFLAYFIIISSLLQTESLFITIYMFFSVLVTTTALVRINDPFSGFKGPLRRSGVIMIQAIPLMVVLFFLFPRIQGSLFGLTQPGSGETGFSDNLAPGSVSRLVQDDAVAFRAMFDGDIPASENLYWRGIVFRYFNGRSWKRAKRVPELTQPLRGSGPVTYTINLEPHSSRWLFALDLPIDAPRRAELNANYTLQSRYPVRQAHRYTVTSYTRYQTGPLQLPVSEFTGLPDSGNPKTRTLAEEIFADADEASEIKKRALDYFEDNGFVYTLEPPTLGRQPVDDFLFDTRQGYCEHYASALAVLFRAADIPARVVGGYLGGEVNPFGNYLIVRQSDAHVWVEFWHSENGWIRVDPTSAVAPDRISGGSDSEGGGSGAGKYMQPLASFFKQLQFGWDAVSSQWEAWFSGYSYFQQMALLKKLGIDTASWTGPFKALLLILLFVLSLFGGYLYFHFRPLRPRPDGVGLAYEQFCRKLGRVGIFRKPDQGPTDYAAEVARKRPDLQPAVDEITRLYIELRYAPAAGADAYKRFYRKVRAFKPHPADRQRRT
ncbi:MAG: transglutaminase TgpA family protein [Thermodesulfobacteriota bacterium]